ncbi:alpha-ribazole phosphatase [Rhodococcus opacus PD630]|nr:alpha-ribazole phosphatase [Rhodococcus opacus PD630]
MTDAPRAPRRLILLRHGQTEYNADNRMQGQLDTELSELGRSQARAAATALVGRRPISIVSSDLRRAYDTAVEVGDNAGLPVQIDERLRETHLGDWQGRHAPRRRRARTRRARHVARRRDVGTARRGESHRRRPPQQAGGRRTPREARGLGGEAGGPGRARRFDRRADRRPAGSARRPLAGAGRAGQHQLGAAECVRKPRFAQLAPRRVERFCECGQ